jgi:hypothetical protein
MEFTVTFVGNNYSEYAIQIPEEKVGIDLLTFTRKIEKCIDYHFIFPKIEAMCQDPTIEITEEIAKLSGHFHSTNNIKVLITPKYLNRFVTKQICNITGHKNLYIHNQLNQADVIEWWHSQNFSLEINQPIFHNL